MEFKTSEPAIGLTLSRLSLVETKMKVPENVQIITELFTVQDYRALARVLTCTSISGPAVCKWGTSIGIKE